MWHWRIHRLWPISTYGGCEERVWKIPSYIGSILIDMYAKCGFLATTHKEFSTIMVSDIVSWIALIRGYIDHGYAEEVLYYFLAHARQMNPSECSDIFTQPKTLGWLRKIIWGSVHLCWNCEEAWRWGLKRKHVALYVCEVWFFASGWRSFSIFIAFGHFNFNTNGGYFFRKKTIITETSSWVTLSTIGSKHLKYVFKQKQRTKRKGPQAYPLSYYLRETS